MSKIYDITGKLEGGMWNYGEPFVPYSMKRISSMEEDGYVASELKLTSHTGTHIDCPRHFGEERPSILDMKLENFMGHAHKIDISDKVQAGVQITREMLVEAGADKLKPGDIMVLNTGWYKEWNHAGYDENYPYLIPDTAQYLVELGLKLFATDIPVIGDIHNTDTDMVLCVNEMPSIYALTDLDDIPEEFTFIAFPLKIVNGDGSPVRAVAVTE